MIAGISDDNGRIGVLAIDHRDSLRAVINPEAPETVERSQIVALKKLRMEREKVERLEAGYEAARARIVAEFGEKSHEYAVFSGA